MKIKFLGTSAGWPLPRIGCSCKICQSKDTKDKRLRPCVLINKNTLIDAGPDIYHQFQKFGITKIKNIIITHAHSDHIFGLRDIVSSKLCQVKGKINLYCCPESKKTLNRVFEALDFNFNLFYNNKTFAVDELKITPFSVVHSKKRPAVGLKVQENGDKNFVYIPDLRKIMAKEKKLIKLPNILILDGSTLKYPFPCWTEKWGHLSIEEGIKLAFELKPKKLYFTHIGHKTRTHKELEAYVQKKNKKFFIAYDGQEINF